MTRGCRFVGFSVYFTIFALCLAMFPNPVAALQVSRPLAVDKRIQTYRYNPNEIYKFIGHYGYQAIIEFAADEKIGTISLGDSVSWQLDPQGNRLFIKPVEQDALTNMTIVTDQRVYHFELHAEEAEDIDSAGMVFLVRFLYPDDGNGGITMQAQESGVPDFSDPEVFKTLNFNYSVVGTELTAPIRIFDDGEFTYFQFRDKNAEVPAFFYVDADGSEGIINFRARGDYIVVERVMPAFTLRNGQYVNCVFNEKMKLPPRIAPVDERTFLEKLAFWN